ncbi:MSHA biogenesis protein MshJ [Oxalobacteraceae bacterium R-40]|uniref:MSHA biogenesis protein MshJ n=1 Tax=Keguizhuia sedimenti TaxID=3064264 RepID=A0ABU1BMK0_9BURK|nr:MSHA biogenesis protein MshJ [Oxalobacteraceae bacterium R-40]
MKKHWQKLTAKIDGLSLRERVIIFAMIAILAIAVFNALLLDPLFAKQKRLSQQVRTNQTLIGQMQTQMRQTVSDRQDPDAVNRARLKELQQQLERMHTQLVEMEKGLVSPDRMPALLGDILRRDSRLTLLSLKTLPVAPLSENGTVDAGTMVEKVAATAGANIKKAEGNLSDAEPVFRHGVEIVVQGSYMDMLQYMDALESMPWQLFWNKARLRIEEYPKATLTLTLYTLSLDKKWLNL